MNLLWQIAAADAAGLSALAAKHGLRAEQVEALRGLMERAYAAAQDPMHPVWPELLAALARMEPSSARPVPPLGNEVMNRTAPARASTRAPVLPFAGSAPAPPRIVTLEPIAAFGETAPVKQRSSDALPFNASPVRGSPHAPSGPAAAPGAPPAQAGDEQASRLAAQFADAHKRHQKE